MQRNVQHRNCLKPNTLGAIGQESVRWELSSRSEASKTISTHSSLMEIRQKLFALLSQGRCLVLTHCGRTVEKLLEHYCYSRPSQLLERWCGDRVFLDLSVIQDYPLHQRHKIVADSSIQQGPACNKIPSIGMFVLITGQANTSIKRECLSFLALHADRLIVSSFLFLLHCLPNESGMTLNKRN